MIAENVMLDLLHMADRADVHAGTPGHAGRVALYVSYLLKSLGTEGDAVQQILDAARLHDIGTLGLPQDVYSKQGALTPEEWEIVRSHAVRGSEYLSDRPETKALAPIVRYHHERYDGKGYPDGLSGEDIPYASRVISVCDSFEAMTHERPYRPGVPLAQALTVLAKEAGTQWDRAIVKVFVQETLPVLMRSGRLMISPNLLYGGFSPKKRG
jgi:polar amino acid transport system substrate-binding protein